MSEESTIPPHLRPNDHRPKKKKNKKPKPIVLDVDGGKQVTVSGVTVTVQNAALDDFELLDELHQLDVKRNGVQLPAILRRFVGNDYTKVLDQLRDPETGRVPIKTGTQFVMDLIRAVNPS